MSGHWGKFNWQDPFNLEDQLSDEERLIRDTAASFATEKLAPIVRHGFDNETVDRTIFTQMGEIGLLGPTIEGYNCSGANYVSYGLIAREIERIDSGYRSMFSVQSSLVMYPIHTYGTEAQKQKYLPKLASGNGLAVLALLSQMRDRTPAA